MPVKYQCPKCERKFVDWGAEKLNFVCPDSDCEGETLVQMGLHSKPKDKKKGASLKRRAKRKTKAKAADKKAKEAIVTEEDLLKGAPTAAKGKTKAKTKTKTKAAKPSDGAKAGAKSPGGKSAAVGSNGSGEAVGPSSKTGKNKKAK